MGLRDLKTDLKSLRYSGDTLGGGTSNQPYIKAKIPDSFNNLQNANSDFILRGGILAARDSAVDIVRLGKMFIDTKSPNGLLFIAKQQLLSRIAVRTQTSGRTLNEGVYSPLNTLAEAGVVAFGGHLVKQGINPFVSTGAYSNNNNLYAVRMRNYNNDGNVDESGLLLNRLVSLYASKINNIPVGIGATTANSIAPNPSDSKKAQVNLISYPGGPGAPLGIGKTNIRFADQRTGINNPKFTTGQLFGPLSWTPKQNTTPFIDPLDYSNFEINQKGPAYNVYQPTTGSLSPLKSLNYLKPDNQIIDSQKTPPSGRTSGSLNGPVFNVYNSATGSISPTQYVSNLNTKSNNPLLTDNTAMPGVLSDELFNQDTFTYTQKDIQKSPLNYLGAPSIRDFRKIIRSNIRNNQPRIENANSLGATPNTPNYFLKNLEKRTNIGGSKNLGPGNKTGKNLVSYTRGSDIGPIDKINALNLYSSKKVTSNEVKNDLVKFRIAAINNKTPTLKTFMHFRAFIDNFSDSYTATWNPINYLGRGEQFYTYNGFTRTISLGWTVAAQSKEELMPMYRKLNYLASNLAPDYTSKGYMVGNLVQLTIGGYLYEQVGFITSLTYDIPAESPWEIGINDTGGYDPTTKEMSHILKVTGFSFTPIHDFIPSKQTLTAPDGNVTGFGNQKYIALSTDESVSATDGYSYIDSTTNALK
jgi:hypothetical protein